MQIERPTLSIALFRRAPAVSHPRATAVAITALACAALLSACGSSKSSSTVTTKLDTARVARSIEGTLLEKRKIHATVACPEAVPQKVGGTFECIATFRAPKPPHALSKAPFIVTIQTSRGYVTYVGK